MKFIQEDHFQYSPSDLIAYMSCRHLTRKDLTVLKAGNHIPSGTVDNYSELLQKKGKEHEETVFTRLKKQFPSHVGISTDKPTEYRIQETLEAIAKGTDLIYQAVLENDSWIGYADFLIKHPTPSSLGSFSYEVFDTKLAKSPRPEHIIQICSYSDLLGTVQGILPEKMHLILGDSTERHYNVSEFHAYYVYLKKRFESFVKDTTSTSYPEPCSHCDLCHWKEQCKNQWRQDDHLSLIANITRSQRDKISKANLPTVASFAHSDQDTKIANLNQDVRIRLQSQAKLQVKKKQKPKDNFHELLTYSSGRGLDRLPSPSPGDLFFDIEGDPLYEQGLEYLFGVFYHESKEKRFEHWWSHSHTEEKETFRVFIEFLNDHLQIYPDSHIYHYNHYETTALKRLAAKYAIMEEDVDNLLRNRKFVDLYTVARESVRTSEPGFSLKNLEVFYMKERDNVINTADMSVIFYNKWRECESPELLDDILNYNKTDCESTFLLQQWLLSLKQDDTSESEETGGASGSHEPPPPLDQNNDESKDEKGPKHWEIEYETYKAKLLSISKGSCELGEIVAQLLEFHRRESKVEWWETYARQDKFIDELLDDLDCLAGLSLIEKPIPEKRSWLYTYQFPPQEYRLRVDDPVVDVETLDNAGTVFKVVNYERPDQTALSNPLIGASDIDTYGGRVILKIGKKQHDEEGLPPTLSIGPKNPIKYGELRNAIYRFADSIINQTSEYQAIEDLLCRSIPRIHNKKLGASIITTNDLEKETEESIVNLQESCLSIQGPPGTGKTTISARVIIELLRQGKKVGIASNSHKAIHVLLQKVEGTAIKQNFDFVGVKKASLNLPDTYYQGTSKETKFIFNLDSATDVDRVINNEFDGYDYNGNVIPLDYGNVLSFETTGLLQRARVWRSSQTRSSEEIEEENEDSPEGVEKTSLEEPLLQFATLFAGTAWLFSRKRFNQQLDYLFIDEAGQVSLANVIAMGTSAKNIVLVGDQMQLAQPTKGTHPGESGKSALEFLMMDHPTIPPDRGIFLNITRRLHPEICSYISKAFYQGRLQPHPDNAKRQLTVKGSPLPSSGILFIPSEHAGCTQKSTEEGSIIKKYYMELLSQQFKDTGEITQQILTNNILVVTPYNLQLNHLTKILPEEAKVGTVDKFQGQEEHIVMISMATSTKEDSPRNMEFLYSRNRLNVALSRAKCLSIIVFNPRLLEASCSTIEQMKLLNSFSLLEQYAKRLK